MDRPFFKDYITVALSGRIEVDGRKLFQDPKVIAQVKELRDLALNAGTDKQKTGND